MLLATYFYDHRSRRSRKQTMAAAPQGAQTIVYHYDQWDHLIGESPATGTTGSQPIKTYAYRDDVPVALVDHKPTRKVYTIETDRLCSPWQVRDDAGRIVWRWEGEAFDGSAPNDDVDGDGRKLTLNLRVPGQYWDPESGLHCNWHRYNAPQFARHLSPDPIEVAGGVNACTSVESSPLTYVDPLGLIKSNQIGESAGVGGVSVRLGAGGASPRPASPPSAQVSWRCEFPDRSTNNVPYVGQSSNVGRRLAEHERAGRCEPGTATFTPVAGDKTTRELSEYLRIRELTGGQLARLSGAVSNQVDPMGPARRHLLP